MSARPNYALMDVVRALDRDNVPVFRLQHNQLHYDVRQRLGRGGQATVYKGALPAQD